VIALIEIKNPNDVGASRLKVQGHSDPKSEKLFRSIIRVPFDPEPSNFIG